MDCLINMAYADAAVGSTADTATGGGFPGGGFPPLVVLAGAMFIFYFLLWRPQSKRAKEQRQLLSSLAIGDEVAISGGLLGKIVELDGLVLQLEVAPGIKLSVQKNAVASLLPKGTLKIG